MRSIETKKGNIPGDIAVENSANIVYTLGENQSVYRKRNISTQIKKLSSWIPLNICCTSSGGLCVIMLTDA